MEDWRVQHGDRVQVEYAKMWYDSEILDVTDDGTICSVVFDDDGNTESDVDVETRIRPAPPPMPLAEGLDVSIRTEEGWQSAKILAVTQDGFTCNARYDAGAEEADIDVQRRVREPRPPLSSLKIGDKFKAKVQNIFSYGAWVDIGAQRNVLLPHPMITTERIDDVGDFLSVGQEVDVHVQNMRDDGKVAVSMLEASAVLPPADPNLFKAYRPDQWITGIVQRTPSYGILVTVPAPGGQGEAVGLVHVSRIKNGYVAHPKNEADVGQKIQVRVTGVTDGKIALSIREKLS